MFVFTAKLIFKSYMPKKLEKGMLFLVNRKKEMVIYQMNAVPLDMEAYVQLNGYPVEPYIVHPGNPNIADDGFVIAHPHQIGWWDVGEESDELYDITEKEYNQILENDGWVDVEVEEGEDEYGKPIPVLLQGLVVLSHTTDDEEEYEEEDEYDYFFDDDDEYHPGNNDDWENKFTNPNHDERYDQD